VHFNVTHSEDVALLAFSKNNEIGIDIEKLNENFPFEMVRNHLFSKGEIKDMDNGDNKNRMVNFFASWTRKESYIKSKGLGFSIPLKSFEIGISSLPGPALSFSTMFPTDVQSYDFISFFPYEDYMASCAVSATGLLFRFFDR
jgi:4'-phosphopantetheinyl transferase